MNTIDKEEAKRQTQMLVELRRQRSEEVKHAQELLKKQQSIRKAIQHALQRSPRSIPHLAALTNIATDEILWHIAAMKKYGIVEEAGMEESGDYYLYRLSKEVKS
jgi:predicted transcriptional regulator